MEVCWHRMSEFQGSMFEHGHRRQRALVIGGGMFAIFIIKKLHRVIVRQRLRKKVEERRKKRMAEMEELSQKLSTEGLTIESREAILKLSLKELQEMLQRRHYSAEHVLMAYQSRALEVTKSTNCVCEIIKEAGAMAKELDSSDVIKGPLHGIPVSLKESFNLAGYNTNIGLAQFLDDIDSVDSNIAKVLKSLGAIPFVRTNIPQTLMSTECSNPVYGVTLNPHDLSRSPGGSSGGEAALIASKGSLLGIGSDIGGSIRIPSNMCGVYGLKPTVGRVCKEPKCLIHEGQNLIEATLGPMAQDVGGLVIAMETLLCPKMYDLDPYIPRLPFNQEIYNSARPLRIGYFFDLPTLQSVPSHKRGVQVAMDALSNEGHTFVQFEPPEVEKAMGAYCETMFGDQGKSFTDLLRVDLPDPSTAQLYMMLSLPRPLRWILSSVICLFNKQLGRMLWRAKGSDSVHDWWGLVKEVEDYRRMLIKHWQELGLDALICPGFPHPAIKPGCAKEVEGSVSYTALYNLLNFPAGSLPVTKVTAVDEENLKLFRPRKRHEKVMAKLMEGSTGLPVNVQCVALPFQEELVLRLMKEIETGLQQ